MDGSTRIDELEQKFIENPRRYFAPLANEYRKAGNPHQAIAICRAHLGQLPGHMSGQIVYGQALFEGGEYEEARTVFENALAMDRENLVALRHLGDLALRNGETAAARQWYAKVLELDPKDATVIALVNEIDAADDAQSPPGAVEESAQQPGQPEVPEPAAPVVPVAASEPDSSQSEHEDRLISEELGYPVPPPKAFVTETMAELYLAQGFRDRAVGVYRQLAEMRPDDERLRAKLAELEDQGAPPMAEQNVVELSDVDDSAVADAAPQQPSAEFTVLDYVAAEQASEIPVEAREEDSPSEESPALEPVSAEELSPSVESPAGTDGGGEPQSVEWSADEMISIDLPPAETPSDAGSVEAPDESAFRAEPEGIAAQLTVREFFAGLGRRRPGSRGVESAMNGAASSSASPMPFEAGLSAGADARAAAQLAGAFGHSAESFSSATAPAATAAPGKESEEDVARFRAWLDGLTG